MQADETTLKKIEELSKKYKETWVTKLLQKNLNKSVQKNRFFIKQKALCTGKSVQTQC